MAETLVGRTTREVVFSYIDHSTRVCKATMRMPTGTEVYVHERADGRGFNARIPGTLYTQHLYASDVEPF